MALIMYVEFIYIYSSIRHNCGDMVTQAAYPSLYIWYQESIVSQIIANPSDRSDR